MAEEQYRKLAACERKFVRLYMQHDQNGSAAMKEMRPHLKPESAKRMAHRFRHRPHVALAIAQAIEREFEAFKDTRIKLARQVDARANFDRSAILNDDLTVKALSQWPEEARAVIESFEFEDGKLSKLKTSSRNEASRLQAQILRMLVETHEHTGKDGIPLAPPVFNFGFSNGGPGEQPRTRSESP